MSYASAVDDKIADIICRSLEKEPDEWRLDHETVESSIISSKLAVIVVEKAWKLRHMKRDAVSISARASEHWQSLRDQRSIRRVARAVAVWRERHRLRSLEAIITSIVEPRESAAAAKATEAA